MWCYFAVLCCIRDLSSGIDSNEFSFGVSRNLDAEFSFGPTAGASAVARPSLEMGEEGEVTGAKVEEVEREGEETILI